METWTHLIFLSLLVLESFIFLALFRNRRISLLWLKGGKEWQMQHVLVADLSRTKGAFHSQNHCKGVIFVHCFTLDELSQQMVVKIAIIKNFFIVVFLSFLLVRQPALEIDEKKVIFSRICQVSKYSRSNIWKTNLYDSIIILWLLTFSFIFLSLDRFPKNVIGRPFELRSENETISVS